MVYYEPGLTPHGMAKDPFKSTVVPRPIGWISSLNKDGNSSNLAPYSQFMHATFDPPYIMFAANLKEDGTSKDNVVNIQRTHEFCWSLATYELREEMNKSSTEVPYGEDEFDLAGLEKEYGNIVKCPMVKRSPIKFECKFHSTFRLPGNTPAASVDIVIGQVVGIHIDESVITDGQIDIKKTQPVARCGGPNYAVVRETFKMVTPKVPITENGNKASAEPKNP
ncbi:hypothetical protein JCM10908_006110 [Rhodotorula pacifica]|uniref:flavin reductase family protein n=1 Tax=Rhodotorula pacifica TaxID=1495444 RepID=UPI0031772662